MIYHEGTSMAAPLAVRVYNFLLLIVLVIIHFNFENIGLSYCLD